MENFILDFPDNLEKGLEIGREAISLFKIRPVENVLFSGLGGSGIGGRFVSQMIWDDCKLPIVLLHDYRIPNWVNEKTLVIACSYSGNTEETIAAMKHAVSHRAEITCITSGGKLDLLAREKQYNLISIPPGQPPRTSFGYNSVQMLCALVAYKICPEELLLDISKAAKLLKVEIGSIRAEAAAIANSIKNTIPIIYADTYQESLAVRLRQQINENAKMLCWHHTLPEMNHNELVAWAGANSNHSVLMIRTPEDHPGTSKRMELTKEVLSKHTDKIIELRPKGENRLERAYYLIHLGDWISYFLAAEQDIDPIEIEIIDEFKKRLLED